MSYTNFVQLKLAAPATAAQTTLVVTTPVAPFAVPAANGSLTLLDIPDAPTKAEIVTYTTVTDNGNGTHTLGGVARAQEGTTAQAWAVGAGVFQSLTAAQYAADLGTKLNASAASAFGLTLIDDANAAAARTTLGLGTAAVATLTTSAVDTAAGRVLKVGDFGLGAVDLLDNAADLNTISATGFYLVIGANQPSGQNAGFLIVTSNGAANSCQRYITQGNTREFIRVGGNSTWGDWQEVWTAANLVKTVSATDTTAGRVLKVGDFGLGSSNPPYTIDINSLSATGLYRGNSDSIGGPSGAVAFNVIHQKFDATATQIALDALSPSVWIRHGSETGQPWYRVATSANGLSITLDTGSFGYGTGSGGTVTQATSKSTAVTLNKPSGSIIMNNEALPAGASVQFQLVNSKLATTDHVIVTHSGGGALLNYSVRAWVGIAGSIYFALKNESAGTLSDTVKINFTIIKGSES